MRSTSVAVGAAAALALAGWVALRDAAPRGGDARLAARGAAQAPRDAARRSDPEPWSLGAAPASGEHGPHVGGKPPSLAGTRVDGGLVADAAGRFVPTPDARRLFDYFFAASGEEPDDVIVARIRAEIARRLSPGAAREATVLLERYVAYRARARGLAEQGLGEGSAAERLATLRELRRETLGADTAEALFAEEEEIDTATVAKLELEQAGPLTEAERTRRTAEIESALPVEERESRRAAMAALDLRAAEAELAAGGGSAGELQALRERMVGAEAAQRLAALDEQRRLWRQRVAGYRSARAAIEADPALDPRRRDEALARLRAERFTETERLRVDALDAVDGR